MRAVQAAMVSRELYFPDHPAVAANIARAVALLRAVLAESDPIVLAAVSGKVVWRNRVLPSSATLCGPGGLFARLGARQVSSLTISRGVEEAEIVGVIARLGDGGAGSSMESAAHVRFGAIAVADASIAQPPAPTTMYASNPEETLILHTGVLGRLWTSVDRKGETEGEELEGLVADVCVTVALARNAMIPLAALKSHDEYTFIHTINVAILSAALGEAVGLPPDTIHDLTAAALLHDIGKQRIPRAIINKGSGLTDAERAVVQSHPEEGARLLFGVPGLPDIAPIVAFEHHLDIHGGGYPRVPRGWKMHPASQIVQLADVFDALSTHRPYRPALPPHECCEIMAKGAGSVYDAELLALFFNRIANRSERSPEGGPTSEGLPRAA